MFLCLRPLFLARPGAAGSDRRRAAPRELSRLRSKSLANRRQRHIQAKVRSTTQRRGMTVNPGVSFDFLTISRMTGSPRSFSWSRNLSPLYPPSANTFETPCALSRRSAITSGAPSRSCMSAVCTRTTIGLPSTSTAICRFRPLIFFPASYPEGPPLSVVFTDWLSMIAAVLLAPRLRACQGAQRV